MASQRTGLIILHSGAYDRAHYALSLALAGLVMGEEVALLCTYEGLERITRGRIDELGEETPTTVREAFRKGLASGAIRPLSHLLQDALEMGLKIYACAGAMSVLNISRNELIEPVTAVVGVAQVYEMVRSATSVLYI